MDKKEDCTIIVNSCDKYEEAWYPFFELLKKFWPNRKADIILNTEKKQYRHEGLTVCCVNYSGVGEWSDRLIHVLKAVDSRYVILLLEDFFLQGYVDQKEIDYCISCMKKNENIAVFYFKHITGHDEPSSVYKQYNKMDVHKKYIINCQAALWEKSALLEFLVQGESPWKMEEEGHLRLETTKEFYCSKMGTYKNSSQDVFNYLWAAETGYGICKSKWLWNNKYLFRKYNIKVNYKSLSEMTWIDYIVERYKDKFKIRGKYNKKQRS